MEAVKLMNRVDTKYVCHEAQIPAILEAAKDDYRVQEVVGKRIATYDTVYYDTADLEMYIRHHDQKLNRRKVRVRTYMDTGAEYLEVKKKNNRGRTKKKRIDYQSDTAIDFIAKHTPYNWTELHPAERTAFDRITLVNNAKTERLTMDFHLRFEAMESHEKAELGPLVIIELKRDGLKPSKMQHILRDMRIFPMKISKYCIGVAMTIPQVKHNRFKEKIVKLNKLVHYARI